jgi:hypothetical protein
MFGLESFTGVWKRTKLYEPIGELGPEEEQRKDVYWLQTSSGLFIDIRYEEGVYSHLKMKSFAGMGSYDQASENFTWTRNFDFRPTGPPDIGRMRLLLGTYEFPTTIEEDGVLPGDDYREIWENVAPDRGSPSWAAEVQLRSNDGTGAVKRNGLVLFTNGWFAITLSREKDAPIVGLEPGKEDDVLLSSFDAAASAASAASAATGSAATGTEAKAGAADAAAIERYVFDYVSLMGTVDAALAQLKVQFALQPSLRGKVFDVSQYRATGGSGGSSGSGSSSGGGVGGSTGAECLLDSLLASLCSKLSVPNPFPGDQGASADTTDSASAASTSASASALASTGAQDTWEWSTIDGSIPTLFLA